VIQIKREELWTLGSPTAVLQQTISTVLPFIATDSSGMIDILRCFNEIFFIAAFLISLPMLFATSVHVVLNIQYVLSEDHLMFAVQFTRMSYNRVRQAFLKNIEKKF
jgi:hypothetical protein